MLVACEDGDGRAGYLRAAAPTVWLAALEVEEPIVYFAQVFECVDRTDEILVVLLVCLLLSKRLMHMHDATGRNGGKCQSFIRLHEHQTEYLY